MTNSKWRLAPQRHRTLKHSPRRRSSDEGPMKSALCKRFTVGTLERSLLALHDDEARACFQFIGAADYRLLHVRLRAAPGAAGAKDVRRSKKRRTP
jgi:hypothetical protein